MPVYTSSIEVTADYPTIKPSLNLNFARSRALDPRITFTRASVGTYVGRDGLVKTAGEDEPRFDHNSSTLESLGLLIEESRTNQIPVSDFSSGWNTSNATLVSGISDPEGGTNARKLVATSTNGVAACFITYNSSITSGNVYTQSVWAKANAFPVSGDAFYVLQLAPSTGFDSRYQNFDLSNGTLGTGDVESATIEAFPDGWYRCSITQTATTTASGRIAISLQNSPTDTRLLSISTGSANNDGIYVWGAQLEVGSFPTSYIPTSGSAVTRANDDASITGESFSSWYNASESTIFFESGIAPTNNSKYFTFFGSDGGGTELIEAAAVSGPGANIFTYADSTVHSNISVTDASATALKYAAGVKANDINLAVNGTLGTTDTSSTQPDAINQLIIGNYSSGSYYANTTIKKLSYYPKRLTNAQLQLLTS